MREIENNGVLQHAVVFETFYKLRKPCYLFTQNPR